LFVQRLRVLADQVPGDQWPFTVPAIAEVARDGLEFARPVTFLVGENASGKSTLLEAVAEGFGLDARGGRAGRKYGNDRPLTPLGQVIDLELTAAGARMRGGPRARKKGFFLRAETVFGLAETVSGMDGYWEADVLEQSHGEGFWTILVSMFREPGLYLLDEPEAALSFTSCLRLVGLLDELGHTGAQVVCATHSPIISALPGADIVELGEHGLRRTSWDDLDMVDHYRRYLGDPAAYLRRIVGPAAP
jgi:predicted ATPase